MGWLLPNTCWKDALPSVFPAHVQGHGRSQYSDRWQKSVSFFSDGTQISLLRYWTHDQSFLLLLSSSEPPHQGLHSPVSPSHQTLCSSLVREMQREKQHAWRHRTGTCSPAQCWGIYLSIAATQSLSRSNLLSAHPPINEHCSSSSHMVFTDAALPTPPRASHLTSSVRDLPQHPKAQTAGENTGCFKPLK